MTQIETFTFVLFVQGVIAGLALQRWWWWRREAKLWRTVAALFRQFPPRSVEARRGPIDPIKPKPGLRIVK